MRIASVIFLLVISFSAFSKERPMYKNIIGLESGMYHRGLIGVSYHRLNMNHEDWMFAAGGGAGIGSAFLGTNEFYFATAFTGYGFHTAPGDQIYAFVGSDIKYIDYHDREWTEETDMSYRVHYSGFAAAPYFGVGGFEESVFFQMRCSPWLFWFGEKHPLDLGGVGITVGKTF